MLSLLSLAAALATAGGCVTVPNKTPGIDAGSTNSPLSPNGTKFSRFWKQQGNKLAALGKPPATKAASGDPGAEFFVVMGQSAEKDGDLTKAESFYRKALEVDPKSLLALAAFAHFEDRRDHLESATKYYRRAIARYPLEAGICNDLALCYQHRGMLGEAAEMLLKATELQPDKPLFHNNLASVLVEGGEDQNALKELMVSNSEAVAHYNLACLLHRRGADELAVEHFRLAVQCDPTMAPAEKWLAKLSPAPASPAEPAIEIAQSPRKQAGEVLQPARPAAPSSIELGQADAGPQRIPRGDGRRSDDAASLGRERAGARGRATARTAHRAARRSQIARRQAIEGRPSSADRRDAGGRGHAQCPDDACNSSGSCCPTGGSC